jgi:uncharacterized protein YyaL (SSP411 family)
VRAGLAFQEKRFTEAALRAATFIKKNMWKRNKLYRRWRDNETSFPAGLDEYSYLIRGVIALFEATGEGKWLSWAMDMTEILESQFKAIDGAFFQTDGTDSNIILQRSQFSDGAEPSGNAIHTENLLRLNQLTYNPNYLRQAEDVLKAAQTFIETYPPGYCYHVINLNRYYDVKSPTIVVALNDDEEHRGEIEEAIFQSYIPHKAVIWMRENDEYLMSLLPHLKVNPSLGKQTTLYICTNRVCNKPLTDLKMMKEALSKL